VKLAFTTLGCPDWDLDTIIARAVEYGFDGVDFRGCAGEMDLWELPEFSSALDRTAQRLRGAGLAVPCVSSSARLLVDSEDEKAESRRNLVEFARIGAGLGAGGVRVFGGHNRDRSDEEALTEAVDRLDEMARTVGESGVAVLVETHDSWIATARLRELLAAAREPNVGAIWDINHPFRACRERPEESWAGLGAWVRYVHVKDTGERGGTNRPVLLGEGSVPVRETIRLLQREGYAGWYAFEWEKKWHPDIEEPEVAFPHYVRFMRGLSQ